MTPWESWPARLALTQPTATALASSSDAPAALSRAAPMRVRRSACTIAMGGPLSTPAHERVLLVVVGTWSQSDDRRASGKISKSGAAASAAAPFRFHQGDLECPALRGKSAVHGSEVWPASD